MNLLHHTLDNGIRLVHFRTNSMVSHSGLMINTGSRDEAPPEHGMAHFIEHMLFKGTSKHKSYYILSHIDELGGELNAYTTKEETTIFASVLTDHFEKAADMISEIVFNSVFPEAEIKKEKDVIIEEINSYLDNPAELIFDEFEEIVFQGNALGRNILGAPKTVKAFTGESIRNFIKNKYDTRQMVFCSVGNIPDERVLKTFRKYFGHIPLSGSKNGKLRKPAYKPLTVVKKKDTNQNHCIIGNIAYNINDSRRPGLFLLNNILGGPGMNSRLNLMLRESKGLAYNVESSLNSYRDTGLFYIYFGTESQNLEKSMQVVRKELDKLRKNALGSLFLHKAKNQLKGYLARSSENYESLMLGFGKSFLATGKIDLLDVICNKIDNLSSKHLLEIANEVFEPSALSTIIYK